MSDPLNSPLTSEIRGKLDQWIYARNPQGPFRRPYQEHKTMSSPAQNMQQAKFKAAALRWNSTLTDAQRQAWRTFTENYPRHDKLGQTYAPSGQNRHASCNTITNTYNSTFLDNPPLDLHCHQPTLVEILIATAAPQALRVRMFGTLDADELWVLCATPLTNVGKSNVSAIWRPLDFSTDALPYTYDAIAEYTIKFTALTAGKRINVKLQIANLTTGTISKGITATRAVT